jgi:hypothetical protein
MLSNDDTNYGEFGETIDEHRFDGGSVLDSNGLAWSG